MDNAWTNGLPFILVGLHVTKKNDEEVTYILSCITFVVLYLTYFYVVFQNSFICYQIKDSVIANFWVHLRNCLLLEETESVCTNLVLQSLFCYS